MTTLQKPRASFAAPSWPDHTTSRRERRERQRLTQRIGDKAAKAPIPFDPQAGASQLPIVISTLTVLGESQRDCIAQTLGALLMQPTLRCIVGTVLARVTAPTQDEMWQCVWLFHCWLMKPDGTFLDPSHDHVKEALAINDLELNGDGSAVISLQNVGPFQLCSATPSITSSLVYAPGRIYYDPGESHQNKTELLAWGAAARHCWKNGGWSYSELEEGLKRLDLEEQFVRQAQGVEQMDARAKANGWSEDN
jgi:hypothetical protein